MGRWDLTALTINGIIGSGIFGVPSAVAKLLGVSSPIAFVVCAAIVYIFVLCFAEVASYFSETGGPYLYGQTAFGPFVGFEVGWSVWLARVSAFAANSNILVLYLGFFVPQATRSWGRAAVLIVVTLLLALINIRGIQAGARVGNAFAAMKVGVLSLFGIAGLFFVDWSRFKGFGLPDSTNFGAAVLLLIYVFTGFEYAVIPAAEAKDPKSHLASALIGGLGICAAIYITVQIVAVGTVPNLAESQRPLADAGRNFLGPVAGGLIALTVCVSIIGNLSAMMLISPRLTYAFAKGGDFPALFANLHPRRGTPVVSIIFFTATALVLAISGSFAWLATVSVIARLTSYAVTCAAIPVLRKRSDLKPGFQLPLANGFAVLGVGLCAWLVMQTTWRDIAVFLLAALVGGCLYLARPKKAEVRS